jgi:hypothetical protein
VATRTATGLTVTGQLDRQPYIKGIQITEEEMSKLNITKNTFHGEWNYSINEQKCTN